MIHFIFAFRAKVDLIDYEVIHQGVNQKFRRPADCRSQVFLRENSTVCSNTRSAMSAPVTVGGTPRTVGHSPRCWFAASGYPTTASRRRRSAGQSDRRLVSVAVLMNRKIEKTMIAATEGCADLHSHQ